MHGFYFACNGMLGLFLQMLSSPFFLTYRMVCSLIYKQKHEKTDLRGYTAIITGANTGIGKRTAAHLAKMGAVCVLACRDKKKGAQAAKDICNEVSNANPTYFPFASEGSVIFLEFDGSEMKSVFTFASIVLEKFRKIDILICNAGLNAVSSTNNGLDTCFQVNYLCHYLLFCLIQPILSDRGRVVNVSSVMHHFGDSNFRSSAYNIKDKDNKNRSHYSDSKLYLNLLTLEINRRYHSNESRVIYSDDGTSTSSPGLGANVCAVSVNPGAVRSDIWRNIRPPWSYIYDLFMRIFYLTVDQAAYVLVTAATTPISDIHSRPSSHPQVAGSPSSSSSSAHKLVPYLVPYFIWPQPLALATEMLSPAAVSPQWSHPTLPNDAIYLAKDLWNFSGMLCTTILAKDSIRVILPE